MEIRKGRAGEGGMQWKRKTPYLLVISAGFPLVPKDEFDLEPSLVKMDSNLHQQKRKQGTTTSQAYVFTHLRMSMGHQVANNLAVTSYFRMGGMGLIE